MFYTELIIFIIFILFILHKKRKYSCFTSLQENVDNISNMLQHIPILSQEYKKIDFIDIVVQNQTTFDFHISYFSYNYIIMPQVLDYAYYLYRFKTPGDYILAMENQMYKIPNTHTAVPYIYWIANNGDACSLQLNLDRNSNNITLMCKNFILTGRYTIYPNDIDKYGIPVSVDISKLGTMNVSNTELPDIVFGYMDDITIKSKITYNNYFIFASDGYYPFVYYLNYNRELVRSNLKNGTFKNLDNIDNLATYVPDVTNVTYDPNYIIQDQYVVPYGKWMQTHNHICKVSDIYTLATKLGRGQFIITIGDGVWPYCAMKDLDEKIFINPL